MIICMVACLITPYLYGDILTPFAIVGNRVIAALGYYILGVLLIRLKMHKRSFNTMKVKLLSSLSLTALGIVVWCVFGNGVNFFAGSFVNIPGLFSAILLFLACIVWLDCMEGISKLKQIKRFLNYYGENSLIVMVVHPTLLLFATYSLSGVFKNIQGMYSVVVVMLLYIALIVAEIPFIWFINHYIPFVIGKRKPSLAEEH